MPRKARTSKPVAPPPAEVLVHYCGKCGRTIFASPLDARISTSCPECPWPHGNRIRTAIYVLKEGGPA